MRRSRFLGVAGVLVAIGVLASWVTCAGSARRPEPRPERKYAEASHERATRAPRRARPAGDPDVDESPSPGSVQPPRSDDPAPGASAPSTRTISVYVSDEGGAPIEDVWTYLDSDGKGGGERLQGRTDASGVARFLAVSGARRVDVAEKSVVGRSFLPVGPVRVADTETDVRIRLLEGAAIEGRVIDEAGEPVNRVNVALVGPDGFRNNITTFPTGEFRLAAPRGSICDLRLGFAGAELFPDEDFEGALDGIAAGTSGVVLRARRIPKDRTLSVVVVDPDGSPVPGAYVAVVLHAFVQGRNADADGRCRFEGLPGRELSVTASSLGAGSRDIHAPSRRVSFFPNGQEIVAQLRRANLVSVVLIDPSGAALDGRGVYVSARAAGTVGAGARADETGRLVLRIPADEPGLWHLEAREADPARDEGSASTVLGAADVSVPAAAEVRLVIDRKPRR